MRRHIARAARGGFTILEMVIASSIFVVLAYVLVAATRAGEGSQGAVTTTIERSESLRSARGSLANELRTTSDDVITVEELADGNDELTFMMPITVGGTNTWGVYDRSLGATEDEQNQEGWFIRYTVEDHEGCSVDCIALVRQILDDQEDVQEEELIVEGLSCESQGPAFQVEKSGEMWEIRVKQAGYGEESSGEEATFYVYTRN